MRIGCGFDIHPFGSVKPLIIGGVLIPYKRGLIAYSDGDVLVHAVIDALLGAAALGDIGTLFPSNNPMYNNINSRELLRNVWKKIQLVNYNISNIDATIIAEHPKMSPYVPFMKLNFSSDLDIKIHQISIKSTSSKEIGCIGRQEGIACQVIVMLIKNKKNCLK